MTLTPAPLLGSLVHLHPDGAIRTERPEADTDLDRDGWLLMVARAESDDDVHGDHWECHTGGDELVACLTGGLRLVLRADRPGEADEEIVLAAGTAAVVPRGRWHRLALDAPSDMVAVTLPRGTRTAERTGHRVSGRPISP